MLRVVVRAGKKETITRVKCKMQKRYICDSSLKLHRKFLAENPSLKVSYAMFCRLRPFFVLLPTLNTRETCCCKLHENLQLLGNKLVRLHLLKRSNIEELADSSACSRLSKFCMYSVCSICCDNTPDLLNDNSVTSVESLQWQTSNEQRLNKKGNFVSVKVTKKELVKFSRAELFAKFLATLKSFRKHIIGCSEHCCMHVLKQTMKLYLRVRIYAKVKFLTAE